MSGGFGWEYEEENNKMANPKQFHSPINAELFSKFYSTFNPGHFLMSYLNGLADSFPMP
jgi:hypothetical protein